MIYYVFPHNHQPQKGAAYNRIRLFCKGHEENGFKAKILSLDLTSSVNPIVRILALIYNYTYLLLYVYKNLTKRDVIIFCGETVFCYLYRLISWKTNLVIERTEYPFYKIVEGLSKFSKFVSIENEKYYKYACCIITCSSYLKKYYSTYCNNVIISPLIVDIAEFTKAQNTRRPMSEEYIAYCGSLDNNKDGVPILIQAFAKFHDIYPKVRLVIIGPGSEKSVAELESIIKENKITDSVFLVGAIDHDKMSNWLNNAVMLALSRPNNKQAEGGIPSKVGEYYASGAPCVITDVGDIATYFTDGVDCYIATAGSVDSFFEKLKQCYESDNKNIIERALHTVKQFGYKEQSLLLVQSLKSYVPRLR